jgi:hypothetical protein
MTDQAKKSARVESADWSSIRWPDELIIGFGHRWRKSKGRWATLCKIDVAGISPEGPLTTRAGGDFGTDVCSHCRTAK